MAKLKETIEDSSLARTNSLEGAGSDHSRHISFDEARQRNLRIFQTTSLSLGLVFLVTAFLRLKMGWWRNIPFWIPVTVIGAGGWIFLGLRYCGRLLGKMIAGPAISIATTLLIIVGLEAYLQLDNPRIAWWSDWPPGSLIADEEVGLFFTPGMSIRIPTPEIGRACIYKINSHGYRGRDWGREGGGFMFLGDSFMVGCWSDEADTPVAVCETELNSAGLNVECYNLAVNSRDMLQYANTAERHIREIAPEIVVTGIYLGNDLGRPIRNYEIRDGQIAVPLNLLSRAGLRTGAVLDNLFLRARESDHRDLLSLPPAFRKGQTETDMPDVVAAVLRLQRITQARGAKLVVFIFPTRGQWRWKNRMEGYDPEGPSQQILTLCRKLSVDCVDLTPQIRQADLERSIYYDNDVHWTRDGDALAGHLMARYLQNIVRK